MFQKLHYHQQACTLLYTRTFLGWHLPIFGPYVPRVCCVIPSYIVSAHLVSYCLLVRQQQRFRHPTLRTSVTLVVCIRTRDLPTCPSKASVYEAKRIATSTTTTHTRDNKPFEAAAVQQRRCPQLLSSLAVSAAVRTWCGGETSTRKTSTSISNAMLLKK